MGLWFRGRARMNRREVKGAETSTGGATSTGDAIVGEVTFFTMGRVEPESLEAILKCCEVEFHGSVPAGRPLFQALKAVERRLRALEEKEKGDE